MEGLLQGWTDDPLNENGVNLAVITGKAMCGIRFDVAISSPLKRAMQTARLVLDRSGNSGIDICIDDRIKEINMGDWEQKRFRPGECEISETECKAFFTNAFHFSGCPNGENIQQVCDRTQGILKELAAKPEYQDKTVLVATHGFALRAMLNFLYEDKSDYWHGHVPYNCAVNIIEAHDGQCKLIADDKVYYDAGMCVDRYAEF
ncbi:MAG: histidine phosphatase family protein [Oscillospiraceae bacterium]|nr:histidine phosphatase family protein [Oscillospiraceae bacterium]